MSIPKKPKGYHRPKSYARTALIISLLSTIACSPSQKTMEKWISSGHDIKYMQHLKKQIDKSNSTLKIDKDIIPTLRSGLASGNNNVIHEIENIILENHNIRPLKETAAYELRNSNVSPSQFQRLFQYRLSQPLESMQTKMIGIYLSRVESPLLYKELINSIKTYIPNNDYERCTKAVHSFSSISELHQKTAFNLSQSIDECKKAYEDSERKKEAWTSASMTTEALKLESKNLDTNYKNALESNKKTPVILF